MSSRRKTAPGFTHAELNVLVLKLQAMLPESSSSYTKKVPASKVLKETCSYIKKLHREVDDLSDQLSHLLASMDNNTDLEFLIRTILQK